MANDTLVRNLAVGGLIEDNPLTSGAVTLTSAGLAALSAIASTQVAKIILDPDGLNGAPEVVYVTAHTAAATTATITRGRESTAARQHDRDVPWIHGPTLWDFFPAITKAGAITDADFPHAPPDGTQGIDTTNNRLYTRVATVWKYAALT